MMVRRVALVVLLLVAACAEKSKPDIDEAIELLPAGVDGPFPLINETGVHHGWIAIGPDDAADAFEDLEVDGGWVRVTDVADGVQIEFDVRSESAADRGCTNVVERFDGTPREALAAHTDQLGQSTHYIVKHKQWLGDPAAYVSIPMEDGTRVNLNAITVDDGSLVLVSTCD
jgi:hypothetical protein